MIYSVKSLYKKAELVNLSEQKLELAKSIKEGTQYRYFLSELDNKHYLSAISHIYCKEHE